MRRTAVDHCCNAALYPDYRVGVTVCVSCLHRVSQTYRVALHFPRGSHCMYL